MTSVDNIPTGNISELPAVNPLRDSAWAMRLFNYRPEQRCAWWQFCAAANVPMIRLGPRKIMFDEQQVRDWIARRSTGKAVAL